MWTTPVRGIADEIGENQQDVALDSWPEIPVAAGRVMANVETFRKGVLLALHHRREVLTTSSVVQFIQNTLLEPQISAPVPWPSQVVVGDAAAFVAMHHSEFSVSGGFVGSGAFIRIAVIPRCSSRTNSLVSPLRSLAVLEASAPFPSGVFCGPV